jgi:hypothetical protein
MLRLIFWTAVGLPLELLDAIVGGAYEWAFEHVVAARRAYRDGKQPKEMP